MTTTTTAPTRLCEQCLTAKPISQFRRRTQSGSARLHQCRDCHNAYERARLSRKRQQRDDRRISKALTQIKNESNGKRLELLCAMLVRQFGGTEGFASAWFNFHQRAAERGQAAALRSFESVFRLLKYCDENRDEPADLSDEDLRKAVLEETKDLLRREPELAVAAAREIGWTVIPSDQ
ncbi:hypothetical protein Pan258_57840 [Symmachiella dynata]|uniref:hypothetical protein n=1 Tax=Symmachiella dynata TaxID=2527995 RepID=UPI00118C64AA|nr:hypothetical protein [Symmachiella dynata]QDT51692.1 hypothetical protein Pan258_57840 [Symmachiella dynata]